MTKIALMDAQEQLQHWQRARALAIESKDSLRIAQCNHSLRQTRLIISGMHRALEQTPQNS